MGLEQILFAKIVLPFARGVGRGSLSEVYEWLEGNGVKLGHSFGRRLLRKVSKGRLGVGDADTLAGELAAYVDQNPAAASKLTTVVLKEMGQPNERLEVVREILAAVFELVKQIGRPVVLPGFITGSSHFLIVDVRTDTADEPYVEPAVHPAPGDRIPTITLARQGGPGYGPRPRVWLVTEPQSDEIQRLENAAAGAGPVITKSDPFTESMNGRALVTAITPHDVLLVVPIVSPIGLMINQPTEVLKWAVDVDWVVPMFRQLQKMTEVQADELDELKAAFATALAVNPAT